MFNAGLVNIIKSIKMNHEFFVIIIAYSFSLFIFLIDCVYLNDIIISVLLILFMFLLRIMMKFNNYTSRKILLKKYLLVLIALYAIKSIVFLFNL